MEHKTKDPNAVALGSKGGKARFSKMTKEERHELALKAGLANKKQWEIKRKSKGDLDE